MLLSPALIREVLIIIGPKDSGKSEGLALMSKVWRNMGRVILDVTLKGSRTGSSIEIMPYISHKLMYLFSSIKCYLYIGLFGIVFTDCATNVEESSFMTSVKWIITHYELILSIITTGTSIVLAIVTVLRTRLSFLCSLMLFFSQHAYFQYRYVFFGLIQSHLSSI